LAVAERPIKAGNAPAFDAEPKPPVRRCGGWQPIHFIHSVKFVINETYKRLLIYVRRICGLSHLGLIRALAALPVGAAIQASIRRRRPPDGRDSSMGSIFIVPKLGVEFVI
jgi:hypothetical protein